MLCLGMFICICFLCVRGGYFNKILIKLGIKENTQEVNWAVESWSNCINQLELDVDVAFFGDSITYGGDWAQYFPEISVINLGYAGDNLIGMQSRVKQLVSANPEKVFIMAGINGLKHYGIDNTVKYYNQLINEISAELPDTKIYIQSLLPIAVEKEDSYGSNEMIVECNDSLEKLAAEQGMVYIDLWALYQLDGTINSEYTSDGIHLREDAYTLWVSEITHYVDE